jgi:hypothetical protein
MMGPSRPIPFAGQRAEILYFGCREPATVTRMEGRSVWVEADHATEELRFDLNQLTGHFVLHGEPYYGTRLRLVP